MSIKNKVNELTTRQEEFFSMLEEISYSKVDSYIDSHSTKTVLKKLAKIVLYLVKERQ